MNAHNTEFAREGRDLIRECYQLLDGAAALGFMASHLRDISTDAPMTGELRDTMSFLLDQMADRVSNVVGAALVRLETTKGDRKTAAPATAIPALFAEWTGIHNGSGGTWTDAEADAAIDRMCEIESQAVNILPGSVGELAMVVAIVTANFEDGPRPAIKDAFMAKMQALIGEAA